MVARDAIASREDTAAGDTVWTLREIVAHRGARRACIVKLRQHTEERAEPAGSGGAPQRLAGLLQRNRRCQGAARMWSTAAHQKRARTPSRNWPSVLLAAPRPRASLSYRCRSVPVTERTDVSAASTAVVASTVYRSASARTAG